MNKTEWIAKTAKESSTTNAEAKKLLDNALRVIVDELSAGNRVQLTEFGIFNVKSRASRTGKNPATGKPMNTPAMIVPTFKASTTLKKAVNKAKK